MGGPRFLGDPLLDETTVAQILQSEVQNGPRTLKHRVWLDHSNVGKNERTISYVNQSPSNRKNRADRGPPLACLMEIVVSVSVAEPSRTERFLRAVQLAQKQHDDELLDTPVTRRSLEPDELDGNGEFATNELEASNSPLSDEVFRLREWGTHRVVPLRVPANHHKLIEPTSTNALQKSSRYLTRGIGELAYEGHSWRVKDWAGVADLKQDGAPTREAILFAGTEITIAGRTLIAESPRTIRLRAFCSRLLGWSNERIGTVDQALRAIRLASSGRAVLVLGGRGNMVPIAVAIHRHVLGGVAPFVISDPRRENTPETVRGPANDREGARAFRKALGGTLCVRAERLPQDFGDILKAFREPDSGVRLLVCVGSSARGAFSMEFSSIDIPRLETRRDELARIIIECSNDAIELLGAPRHCLTPQNLEWVSQLPSLTLPEIEKALRRIVAIKTSRNISTAASRLGMTPVSLTRWLARRKVSTGDARYAFRPAVF